jgi:hypothetical protein
MDFRTLLDNIKEETVAGDIASVETKIGTKPLRHRVGSGKRCKKHKTINCQTCLEEYYKDEH